MKRASASVARRRFLALDAIVLGYTAFVFLFTLWFHDNMPNPQGILALHVFVMAAMILVPPRGASWETTPLTGWRWTVRGSALFFRYSYPLLLVLFYFEEGRQTVNAMWPDAPYWFEAHLYRVDALVFGRLPVVSLNDWVGPIQDELMHGFYFSYYLVLIGGLVIAWVGDSNDRGAPAPGRGFQTALTSTISAFLLCFIWYPFLPARGPWENPELMASMVPFEGSVFVPLIETIIQHGAVSGGCFPSSHVAGAWGTVFGVAAFYRKPALVLGFFALGMSLSCVYTRYHHGVDVPAGFIAGVLGAAIGWRLTHVHPPARTTSSECR